MNRLFIVISAMATFIIGLILYTLPANAAEKLTVVELYTSQGCSSCPPADRYLKELKANPNILPLSFHINYWDYIGWKDPYASEDSTNRQRAYARALRSRSVFTPQMIINGEHSVVGSRRSEVNRGLKETGHVNEAVNITPHAGGIVITSSGPIDDTLRVWAIEYQETGEANVARGENRGRHLEHVNVVRGITDLGVFRKSGQRFAIAPSVSSRKIAILVQEDGFGPIHAALVL